MMREMWKFMGIGLVGLFALSGILLCFGLAKDPGAWAKGLYVLTGLVGIVFAAFGLSLGFSVGESIRDRLQQDLERMRKEAQEHASKANQYDWLRQTVLMLKEVELVEGKDPEKRKVEQHNQELKDLQNFLRRQV
jgi:flagellar biosynthesis component FlhA